MSTYRININKMFWIINAWQNRVYPKKYAHGFCFAVLCCGYTLTDFPISIRLTSLALWQSNDCPSASKATLMNMDKYFMWIHYEGLHNHNKAKHNKTVCLFLGIYCSIAVRGCNFVWKKVTNNTLLPMGLSTITHTSLRMAYEVELLLGCDTYRVLNANDGKYKEIQNRKHFRLTHWYPKDRIAQCNVQSQFSDCFL